MLIAVTMVLDLVGSSGGTDTYPKSGDLQLHLQYHGAVSYTHLTLPTILLV